MAKKNNARNEMLNELGMRPVSQVFHQIRYWSALDDPKEERWDYMSNYTRTERREMGKNGARTKFNPIGLIAAMLVLLMLVGVGAGAVLAWPFISNMIGGGSATASTEVEAVTGYIVHLGSRDLGVIRDKAAMETFVSDWLAEQNATSQEGLTYVIAQPITYDEVLIDALYCAKIEDVQNAFVKHAALDIA